MFKKICSVILAGTLALSLFACGGGGGSASNEKLDMETLKLLIESMPLLSEYESRRDATTLRSVEFGSYPQENDPNYKEPIEWLVLDRYPSEGKALLISKYILDVIPYNNDGDYKATYEECDLRKWLNDSFYNTAFTKNEQNKILNTNIQTNKYTINDKVFCISHDEYKKYLNKNYNSKPTLYAKNIEKFVKGYWCRNDSYKAIYGSGEYQAQVLCDDDHLLSSKVGVRPLIWIKYKN